MAERTPRSSTPKQAARITTASTDAAPIERLKRGPKPGSEAAKRGGTAARERHGREFYRTIGTKGGLTVLERHGADFFTQIGRLGGESTKRALGTAHYARIGRIGGKRAHEQRGADGEVTTSGIDITSR